MNTIVRYRLSEAGRKQALLAGYEPEEFQEVIVGREQQEFAEVVQSATLNGDRCVLDCAARLSIDGTFEDSARVWDEMPTVRQLLDDRVARLERLSQQNAIALDDRRKATEEVLRERKLRKSSHSIGNTEYFRELPAWPWDKDEEVAACEEAIAWIAEIEQRNAAARASAEIAEEQRKADLEAERQAAADKEAKRRESLGLKDDEDDLPIANGALMKAPVWETHSRGKNWAAIIASDPRSPGGLAREFFAKAKGDAYYLLPAEMAVGCAVEFGADYYTGGGRKNPKRWYGVVTRIELTYIVLAECDSGKAAVKLASKMAAER